MLACAGGQFLSGSRHQAAVLALNRPDGEVLLFVAICRPTHACLEWVAIQDDHRKTTRRHLTIRSWTTYGLTPSSETPFDTTAGTTAGTAAVLDSVTPFWLAIYLYS